MLKKHVLPVQPSTLNFCPRLSQAVDELTGQKFQAVHEGLGQLFWMYPRVRSGAGVAVKDNSVTAILFYAPWCFYSQQAGRQSEPSQADERIHAETRACMPASHIGRHEGMQGYMRECLCTFHNGDL